MEKKLSEIKRSEWIALNWIEIEATFGSDDRMFMATNRRTPDEAAQASIDWDSTAEAISETKDIEL